MTHDGYCTNDNPDRGECECNCTDCYDEGQEICICVDCSVHKDEELP